MPREIHTLSGDLYQPPSASLAATRWTSNSGRWSARAPFGGRGMGGLGCACQKKQGGLAGCGCGQDIEGLGSVPTQILRLDKPGEQPQLEVTAYVLSQGRLDPTRTLAAMVTALQGLGYGVTAAPTLQAYPLTWIWRYDAPRQVYQASVTDGSGPFAGIYEGLGVLKIGAVPTAADSAALASVGTALTLPKIALPSNADLNQLLGALRNELTRARSNSNVVGTQQTLIKLTSEPKVAPATWGWGLALAAGLFLLSQKDKEQIRV